MSSSETRAGVEPDTRMATSLYLLIERNNIHMIPTACYAYTCTCIFNAILYTSTCTCSACVHEEFMDSSEEISKDV